MHNIHVNVHSVHGCKKLDTCTCTCVHVYTCIYTMCITQLFAGTYRYYQLEIVILQKELCELEAVSERQRSELSQQEQEGERLGRAVQEAEARERGREEQVEREHREDTASLAMVQSQLATLTAEK